MILPASKLELGHCVIANDLDRPCAKMVCVIVGFMASRVQLKYINKDPQFNNHNRDDGFFAYRELVTPLNTFGVEIFSDGDEYWCEVTGESSAKYPDGVPRLWQDNSNTRYKIRKSLLECPA